jgi:hypothetical protein
MRDPDDEIREIRTEIIESRGLIIKTNKTVAVKKRPRPKPKK